MSKLEILFLSKRQVEAMGVGNMSTVMEVVEEVLSLFNKGDHISPYKVVMRKNDDPEEENISGRINAMPGYVGGSFDMAGIKWIGSNPHNHEIGFPRATALVILNHPVSKIPLAVMDGTQISAMRTGAVSGVAVKYLAVKDAKVITVVGAGVQGRTQLEAAVVGRPSLKTAYVYDINMNASNAYAKEMSAKLGIQVIPAEGFAGVEEACRKSDVIITASQGTEPLVQADWVKPGALCICIAGNEFTRAVAEKSSKIVVDTWEGLKHREPENIPTRFPDRVLKKDAVDAELGEVINGTKPGRENDKENIFVSTVGMGIEDVAVATRIYRDAQKQGVGTTLTYWED